MQSTAIMNWIAGWIPLMVIIGSSALYTWWPRRGLAVLVSTVLSLGLPLAAMLVRYTMSFWPWLLLYLFLSWIACWAANYAIKWRGHNHVR